jgi:choloylglycine hydrolase
LDNFNIPLGAHVTKEHLPTDIVSATQVTSSSDLKNKVYYYHTMWNRQIRKINLNEIDFSKIEEQTIDDDASKTNTVKDVTPK